MRPVLPVAAALLWAPAAMAQEAPAPTEEAPASGGDIVRQTHRIDLRIEANGQDGDGELTTTLRYTNPIPIGGGWQVNFRADLPFVASDEVSDENPLGETELGFGDILVQAVFARHVGERDGFGIGAQLIVPTASGEAFGKGKWRLRPTAGYRWGVPSISEDSFFQLLARYDFSFAGDDDRSNVSELQFAPNLEIALPGDAYVSIFPSTDIRYNFVRDEFFLPLNLEVGKSWGRIVASLEGGVGVISGDNPPYDWKLEFRLGFRF